VPLDYHNWVNRNLKPVADKLGIRVNCQIMRRTFATLANEAGGDLTDIQAQMRHARSTTTADTYIQPIPKSVRQSMEAFDRVLSSVPMLRNRKRRLAMSSEGYDCVIAAISAPAYIFSPLKRPKPSI
jgi:hypothetical protein